MALTSEGKIARLQALADWSEYTPQQQLFLTTLAETGRALESYRKAYPKTSEKAVRWASSAMLGTSRIKRALVAMETEEQDDEAGLVEKDEALMMLSRNLRKV